MTSELPRIASATLKNAATPEAVERVWQRLENEAPLGRASRGRGAWSLAFASVTFAAGLWLGMKWKSQVVAAPQVAAEPAIRWVPAAGRDPERADRSAPGRVPAARPARRLPPSSLNKSSELTPTESAPLEETSVEAVSEALPSEWMRLANLGEYEFARQALEAAGGFDAVLGSASPEKLMAAVDVARATGQKGRALQALRTVLEQFSGSPEAPLAAWTLGNMLEQAGDQVGAASAFAWYQRLSPRGDFAEDAVVRQLEALIQHGQTDEARRLAKSYEVQFPESPRLRELSLQLEPSERAVDPATGDAKAEPSVVGVQPEESQ